MTTIAGHTFVNGLCDCGRRWRDIRHVDASYHLAEGYAHERTLTMAEIDQIVAARTEEEARIEQAMVDLGRA